MKNMINDIEWQNITKEESCRAQDILMSDMSDDLKLYEIFQIYKEDIRGTQLYYALLGWVDTHICDLQKEQNVFLKK